MTHPLPFSVKPDSDTHDEFYEEHDDGDGDDQDTDEVDDQARLNHLRDGDIA